MAYETAVLGMLRPGYRNFHLRSSRYGTRIEMCTVFVHISFGVEPHAWAKARELRQLVDEQKVRCTVHPYTVAVPACSSCQLSSRAR